MQESGRDIRGDFLWRYESAQQAFAPVPHGRYRAKRRPVVEAEGARKLVVGLAPDVFRPYREIEPRSAGDHALLDQPSGRVRAPRRVIEALATHDGKAAIGGVYAQAHRA